MAIGIALSGESQASPRRRRGDHGGDSASHALWVYLPLYEQRFAPHDLGIGVYGGFRVLEGFVPYAEMHTPYGPAQYYVRALLFYLFGTNIETLELEYLVHMGIGVAAVYWTLRGCATRVLSLLLMTLVIGMVAFALPSLAITGMVLAVGCMTRYSRRQHVGWLVGVGVFIEITGATRWDFGVYCAVASVAALASLQLVRRVAASPGQAPGSLRVHARYFLLLLAPAALAALPFYVPTFLTDPRAIFRSIGIALGVHDYRTLPWPDLPSLVDVAYGGVTIAEYLSQAAQSFPAYAFFFLGPLNAIALLISLRRRSPVRPGGRTTHRAHPGHDDPGGLPPHLRGFPSAVRSHAPVDDVYAPQPPAHLLVGFTIPRRGTPPGVGPELGGYDLGGLDPGSYPSLRRRRSRRWEPGRAAGGSLHGSHPRGTLP